MDLEAFKRALRGRALILCHHNADPDAICSAQALKELVESLSPGAEAHILLPEGASSASRRVMEALGIEASEEAELERADVMVVVDTSSLNQLGSMASALASSEAYKVFIDHHAPSKEVEGLADLYYVDDEASSTSELIYRLYDALRLRPSERAARAMLIGIAYDSRHLSIAGSETFRVVSRLLELGAEIEEAWRLLTVEMGRSERIARLKAGQRTTLHEVEGWIIASSHVSSHQASAARGLIGLGADVAVVAGGVWEDVRVSLRSTEQFHRETSIHLGRDIAQSLAEELEGSGGGHPTSAGLNLRGDYEEVLKRCVELLAERIRESEKPTHRPPG
jgi:nanoRNase/pAp phosphatase (c-di-AMP/oligoRNAs hydrolase)